MHAGVPGTALLPEDMAVKCDCPCVGAHKAAPPIWGRGSRRVQPAGQPILTDLSHQATRLVLG